MLINILKGVHSSLSLVFRRCMSCFVCNGLRPTTAPSAHLPFINILKGVHSSLSLVFRRCMSCFVCSRLTLNSLYGRQCNLKTVQSCTVHTARTGQCTPKVCLNMARGFTSVQYFTSRQRKLNAISCTQNVYIYGNSFAQSKAVQYSQYNIGSAR